MRAVSFLLETAFYLLIGAALFRAYMNWLRINMTAQPGTFVMALTNWLVKPLRRLLPQALARSKVDSASLVSALVLSLLYALLTALLFGWFAGDVPVLAVVAFAFKTLVRVALQALTILVFGYVIISWVQPGSHGHGLLSRLVEPPLAPLRRIVPMIGGIDLSAMALLLLLQVGLMLLG
jgi:YggT family protein